MRQEISASIHKKVQGRTRPVFGHILQDFSQIMSDFVQMAFFGCLGKTFKPLKFQYVAVILSLPRGKRY